MNKPGGARTKRCGLSARGPTDLDREDRSWRLGWWGCKLRARSLEFEAAVEKGASYRERIKNDFFKKNLQYFRTRNAGKMTWTSYQAETTWIQSRFSVLYSRRCSRRVNVSLEKKTDADFLTGFRPNKEYSTSVQIHGGQTWWRIWNEHSKYNVCTEWKVFKKIILIRP